MTKTVLLMGGSGFIGGALGEHLVEHGWQINLLTRDSDRLRHQTSFPCRMFSWQSGELPDASLDGVEAVINLVGQSIADHPWTEAYKKILLASRLDSVEALKRALARRATKPRVVIQSSAIGYYGFQTRGSCTEKTPAGQDFLAQLCRAWEAAAYDLAKQTRLCIARIGVVLGWGGGAFPKLHDLYCSGLGAVLGRGEQWMNWVHIKDLMRWP